MFGRQNKPSKQNAIGQGPVKEISEELKADDILGYVGNEAANLLDDPLNPDSNESNNNNNALNGLLSHYGSSDLKNFKYKSRRKKDTNNALGNSLSHYSSSDLNNFKYKSGRKNRKNKQPLLIDVSEEENKDEKIQINNEIIPPKKEADHNDLLNDNLIRMKQFFAENGFGFAHPAAKKIHPELNPDNMDRKNPHDKINKKHSNAPKKKIKPFTKNLNRREKNKNLMKGSLSFIEKAQMSLKMRNNPAVNPKKRRTPQEIRIKELFKKKINAKTSGERDAYQTQLDNIYKKQLSQIGKEKENQLNLYKFNKRQKAEALKIPKKWDVEGSEYSKPNMRTLREVSGEDLDDSDETLNRNEIIPENNKEEPEKIIDLIREESDSAIDEEEPKEIEDLIRIENEFGNEQPEDSEEKEKREKIERGIGSKLGPLINAKKPGDKSVHKIMPEEILIADESGKDENIDDNIIKEDFSSSRSKKEIIPEKKEEGTEENIQPAERKSEYEKFRNMLGNHPGMKEAISNLNALRNLSDGKPEEKEKLEDGDEPLIKEEAREDDLTQSDRSLEPIQGLDFVAQKLPARKKQGLFSKIGSWLSYYSGKTFGKIGTFFAMIVKGIMGIGSKKPGILAGMRKGWRGDSGRFQKKGERGAIPGWSGAQFENEAGPEYQVNVDFRRVPDIWSLPIAEKAAEGNDKDKNAKPRDPVISVYISQSSQRYTAAANGAAGRSHIGIEYSRYSARYGRWQRYNLRFGYGMAETGSSEQANNIVTGYNNATVPGRLMNEQGGQYDISRSFPAKPKQVTNVLRAAEVYADQGGYNTYTRNCMTFAKDMIVNAAQIKGAEGFFATDEVYLNAGSDAKMFGAAVMSPIARAEVENGLERSGEEEDLDYQNYGSRMVSRQDYERYRNSLKFWSSQSTVTYSPNGVAENLRRAEGGKSGTIGIFKDLPINRNNTGKLPLDMVLNRLSPLFRDLTNTVANIPLNLEGAESKEFNQLMKDLDWDNIISKLSLLIPDYIDDWSMVNNNKQSNFVKARTIFSDRIKKLNTLLLRFYKNDRRIQDKIMPIINLMNHGISDIDDAYRHTNNKDMDAEDRDLGNLRKSFNLTKYQFITPGSHLVSLTPSEYEAWLQIDKTPENVMDDLSRFAFLSRKKQKRERFSEEEERDFKKLTRITGLVEEFDRSHNYMMEKEDFSQQDVDYAFSLAKKEQSEIVNSDMFQTDNDNKTMTGLKKPNASASGIYKMLIMKGVFGGMKERYENHFEDDYDEINGMYNYNVKEMLAWLGDDAKDCINNHEKEMTTIIRGLKHTKKDANKEDLQAGFSDLLTRWVFQLFASDTPPKTYQRMVKALTKSGGQVMKAADKIITAVLNEA